ncbi:Hpt protein [Rhodobacter ferrooxidans]|uniref:Hpt protein n=2 Tax=Rhodobacter ferrooxidans TaxID=371731 RepID=C8S258_9RHOB|nr:Hpt protein [Rhodobacter sp. SW2]
MNVPKGGGFAMIEWGRVADLRSEIGDEAFGEVIDLFLEETDEVIARLIERPDLAQIERDLHFLKGSALNLGFCDLADLCQDGERRAAAGDAALVDVGAVVRVYFESKAAFQMGLAQSSAA